MGFWPHDSLHRRVEGSRADVAERALNAAQDHTEAAAKSAESSHLPFGGREAICSGEQSSGLVGRTGVDLDHLGYIHVITLNHIHLSWTRQPALHTYQSISTNHPSLCPIRAGAATAASRPPPANSTRVTDATWLPCVYQQLRPALRPEHQPRARPQEGIAPTAVRLQPRPTAGAATQTAALATAEVATQTAAIAAPRPPPPPTPFPPPPLPPWRQREASIPARIWLASLQRAVCSRVRLPRSARSGVPGSQNPRFEIMNTPLELLRSKCLEAGMQETSQVVKGRKTVTTFKGQGPMSAYK